MYSIKKWLGITPKVVPYNPINDIDTLEELARVFLKLHSHRNYPVSRHIDIYDGITFYRVDDHGGYFVMTVLKAEITIDLHNCVIKATPLQLRTELPKVIAQMRKALDHLYSV